MATKITNNYFEFGVHKYFRGNAHLVEIGTYGEKKDPFGPKAYLDPQSKVQRGYLVNRVSKGNPVAVDWGQTTKADLEVNGPIKVFGLDMSASTSFSYEKAKSADLKLFNLSILEGPLQSMLNGDADGARNYLADEGSDGRIVSEVWVVMEAELANHFDTSASISVSAKDVDLDVTAKGGAQGEQTITLSAGTTFAYKLHKVKDWNNGKTRIENMEADYKGMS
jgi:hypothetical protein